MQIPKEAIKECEEGGFSYKGEEIEIYRILGLAESIIKRFLRWQAHHPFWDVKYTGLTDAEDLNKRSNLVYLRQVRERYKKEEG